MAIEQERLKAPCSRRWPRSVYAAGVSCFLVCWFLTTGEALPGTDPAVTVQPGESWASVRNRLFPVDAIRQANPRLDAEVLHPGDVVQAPYVHISEFSRERATRKAVEQQLAEAKGRLMELEKASASLEVRRRDVDRAERILASRRAIIIGLVLVVGVLFALLAFVVKALRAARRDAAEVASRDRALRSSYEELRRSLHDIDVKLQGRVVSLLRLHGGKIVTDAELTASLAPVVDFTEELRKKHATN